MLQTKSTCGSSEIRLQKVSRMEEEDHTQIEALAAAIAFLSDAPRMNSDTVRGITELGMCQDNEKHNLQPPRSSDNYFPSSFIQLVCLF